MSVSGKHTGDDTMILKTTIQATENTEKKRVPVDFPVHLMGGINIYGNQLFPLCELCVLCG